MRGDLGSGLVRGLPASGLDEAWRRPTPALGGARSSQCPGAPGLTGAGLSRRRWRTLVSSRPPDDPLELVSGLIIYLRLRFPTLAEADCEDLAQEAYAELLATRRDGLTVNEPAARQLPRSRVPLARAGRPRRGARARLGGPLAPPHEARRRGRLRAPDVLPAPGRTRTGRRHPTSGSRVRPRLSFGNVAVAKCRRRGWTESRPRSRRRSIARG
jgi:hypothetical protein